MFYNATIIIGLRTAQYIEQCTTPKRILNAVQDILELHHIVNVSEFYLQPNGLYMLLQVCVHPYPLMCQMEK